MCVVRFVICLVIPFLMPVSAEPPVPSFAAKPDCRQGHRPWPDAVCLSCAPPNCILRLQPYRVCDLISFDSSVARRVYSNYISSGLQESVFHLTHTADMDLNYRMLLSCLAESVTRYWPLGSLTHPFVVPARQGVDRCRPGRCMSS